MARMENIKLTKKELFQKIKEYGISSPLSFFYSLVAVILLVSICVTAYLVADMIESLKMTQCRLDVLNEVFLNGNLQEGWDGVNGSIEKFGIVKNIYEGMKVSKSGNWTNQTQNIALA